MPERKLATIRSIKAIQSIPNADKIELATVDGWDVVVNKGMYTVGELVIYLEIDSFVPSKIAPFLTKEGHYPKEFNGVQGERLRTVKLRGQVSQGLILPLNGFDAYFKDAGDMFNEGTDVTSFLGIQKWERPLPACLQGQEKGSFPNFIQKTDEERCQNLGHKIFGRWANHFWEVTIKLDGSSFTGYYNNGETGVCSRNVELKDSEENQGNTFVSMFNKSGLKQALINIRRNVAVQAELMGPGIQGNREELKEHQIFIFKIFDIDKQEYLHSYERYDFITELIYNGYVGDSVIVNRLHVRLHELGKDGIFDLASLLKYAEGPSMKNPVREGLVFKSITEPNISFKAISNKFLLKGGD